MGEERERERESNQRKLFTFSFDLNCGSKFSTQTNVGQTILRKTSQQVATILSTTFRVFFLSSSFVGKTKLQTKLEVIGCSFYLDILVSST